MGLIFLFRIVAAVITLAVGIVIGVAIGSDHPVGDLRVDRSDPTSEPYLFLELDTDVHDVIRKKQVTFRVKLEDFIPRK